MAVIFQREPATISKKSNYGLSGATDLVTDDLPFGIVFKVTIALVTPLHQLAELLCKRIMIKQVMDSKARSRSLSRVGRTDTFSGGPNAASDVNDRKKVGR